jgi:hypothetical protein
MNRNSFAAVVLIASLVVGFSATGNAEEKPEVLYTSPDGAIRIERSGEAAWVISTKDPTQRAKMPPLEGISSVDDEYHSSPNDANSTIGVTADGARPDSGAATDAGADADEGNRDDCASEREEDAPRAGAEQTAGKT